MPHYPWKRYWCSPGDQACLDSNGFLFDPEVWHIGGATSFERLEDNHCLILLGEPGIGKSTALEAEYERRRSAGKEHTALWIDLRRYGDEGRVVQSITGAAQWKAWLSGESDLHLFLDSLDEGRVRVSNLGAVLMDTLKDSPLDRLFLRIACRTADWPATLQDELTDLYKRKQSESTGPCIFELVMLREADARLAAHLEGLNPDHFIANIKAKGAGALAAKPATLKLLLKLAKKGQFPARQVELYELGCLELCQETDQRIELARVDSRFALHDPTEILVTASRIAAVTLLCNRYAVYLGKDSDTEDGDITLSELSGGDEYTSSSVAFRVEHHHVFQTLRCGLFSSRGRDRLGWAHQTYAEYLAARYLRSAPLPQIQSLLADPESGHLIPQLCQVASWLASLRPDVFQWIIGIDPVVVLHSDVATADPTVKAQVVDQLLAALHDERLLSTLEIWSMFSKLRYPAIGTQLRHYIVNRGLPLIVRKTAIEIAAETGAVDLVELNIDIALDCSEDAAIRCAGAWVVIKLGDAASKKRLEPLALGEAGDDPDNRLRGLGMRCVWPHHWTTKDLLLRLVRPTSDDLTGAYKMFLREDVVPHIPDDDIPNALDIARTWADTQHGPRGNVLHGLIQRALQRQDDSRTRSALARTIVDYLHRHHELPGSHRGYVVAFLNEHPDTRLPLLQTIVEETDWAHRDLFALVSNRIVEPADVLWMLDRIEKAPGCRQGAWAELIDLTIRAENSPQWSDRVVQVCEHVPTLREKVAWLFEVWPLNAPKSRKAKARHLRELRWERRLAGKPLIPSPRERLEHALRKSEAGEAAYWINVCISLALESTSVHYIFPSDLEKTHGWLGLDTGTRDRVILAATKYVLECPPGEPTWIGKNEIPYGICAGYPAFRLLVRTGTLPTVPQSVWARWVPALVAIPVESRDEVHQELLQATYAAVPEAVIDCARLLLEIDVTYALHHLKPCWDERLDAAALHCLERGLVTPRTRLAAVDLLMDRGHRPTLEWLVSEVARLTSIPTDIPWLTNATTLAVAFGGDSSWQVVWNVFLSHPDIGEQVVLDLAERSNWQKTPFPGNLSEGALRDLLTFTIGRFPPETDPNIRGVHTVSPREEAGRLRETLLRNLANRGTRAACEVMNDLLKVFPAEFSYLKWYLRESEEMTRRKTWPFPEPGHLLSLLQDHKRRYVVTESQLLEALVSALYELEDHLHGPWTPVRQLWNDCPLSPKDEQALSDYLAEHLTDELGRRGMIINREVQIKRGAGTGPTKVSGERTDLLVQATTRNSSAGHADTLTVVIEVKGCWNPHLEDAMYDQLYTRYLLGNGLSHGLYVVGWFLCDAWVRDGRKSHTPEMTIDEARTFFSHQAQRLSSGNPKAQVKAVTLDLRLGRD